jgi:hypothetical protein
MALITALVAGAASLFAGVTVSSVAAFAVRTLVTIGISKLVANRANKTGAGAQDVGSRFSLGPATNNKLPVNYGSAFLGTVMTDAKITTDQKTMYYVYSICEATSGTMSFGKIFWNGKEVTLGAGDYSGVNKVVSLTTNATPPQVDDTINGNAWIYQFSNGSSSGVNTGGTSAITILQDAGIPVSDRWTSTDTMTNTCFIVVKIVYNKDVQDVQRDPKLSVQVTNTLTKPGEVLLDYMTDTVYGCAIDVANIDTASLTALDAYSDQTITYVPVGGGSATQPRYRIDGPIQTGDNCLSNLQNLVDACDSWLQYSELTGQWTIVMNKPYSGTLGDLYSIDSSVLIGGIDINPIDLNQTYNSLEVQYPNANINDQTDYKVVDLTTPGTAWYDPSLLSPNEPDNRLVVQYPQINNYIRAVYLGVRRLLQSREDLTIVCNLDYSGIQVVAGDVVRVTLAEYGWADKLFRVSQVQETKTTDGFLGARITAFEYNGSIYADNALEDFIPEANTGLSDPNIFDKPSTPIISLAPTANGAINYFTVSSNVPTQGTTLYMDFNYGNTSNVSTHKSYSTLQLGDGATYTANTTLTINVADLDPATYYWSTTARNELAGRQSNSSSSFVWAGPSVTTWNGNTGGITFSQMSPKAFGPYVGSEYQIYQGIGSSPLLPVNVTTSATRNVPILIPGTTVSSTLYWPWAQGTSTTSDGYGANSTSVYAPAEAALIPYSDGTQNYYTLWSQSLSGFVGGETLLVTYSFQIVSDSDNSIAQISDVTFAGSSPYITTLNTQNMKTINLPIAYQPQYFYASYYVEVIDPAIVAGTGITIRNIVGGTNITIAACQWQAREVKIQ